MRIFINQHGYARQWARSLVVKRPVCNGRPRVRFSAGPFSKWARNQESFSLFVKVRDDLNYPAACQRDGEPLIWLIRQRLAILQEGSIKETTGCLYIQ